MCIKLILVSAQAESTRAYLSILEKIPGIKVDTVASFGDLHLVLKANPYHGVMIDLAINVAATTVEKELARRIQEAFHVLILKWGGQGRGIGTFSYKQGGDSVTLQDFIHKQCGSIQARTLHSSVRKNVNFNVLLSKDAIINEKSATRTITINVSKGGGFIYSSEDWKCFSNVWLVMNDLKNHTPIMGEVRQRHQWGETMRIPGIGVTFKDIKKCQLEEICRVIE